MEMALSIRLSRAYMMAARRSKAAPRRPQGKGQPGKGGTGAKFAVATIAQRRALATPRRSVPAGPLTAAAATPIHPDVAGP
jgi:hypothetical protein